MPLLAPVMTTTVPPIGSFVTIATLPVAASPDKPGTKEPVPGLSATGSTLED
jgi:hypothetical protein